MLLLDAFYYVTFFDLVIIAMLLGLFYLVYQLITAFASLRNTLAHSAQAPAGVSDESRKLKLQALERLTLFTERSGLKNLVERLLNTELSAAEMHHVLVDNLKQEFEYNQSQQIYVSPEIWHAVTRLKDQNIYVINHITANLSPQATASDLCRMIVEYSLTPNAEMNQIVLDALNTEAKNNLN
jgi:hypothetical protein